MTSSQDYLFQRISELLPPDASMVDLVSEVLNVSNDSAYRRIRGETALVLEEARQLCDHFKLSLDQLLSIKSGFTLFRTERINAEGSTFENYLEGIYSQLQQVAGFAHKEIIYLTKDIPIWQNFIADGLFAFRYFFWMKSILRHPEFENRKFSSDCLPMAVKELGRNILKVYNEIFSTEIWNTESINSIIFQVKFYREAGYFASETDIKAVYSAVEEMIGHLRVEAEYGCKFIPGENPILKKSNFRFFHNRMTLGDNTIIAITDKIKTVFLNYDVMNYMVTRDEKFCQDTYDEVQALIRRSTLISGTSEKQRNIFFNVLARKIRDQIKTS